LGLKPQPKLENVSDKVQLVAFVNVPALSAGGPLSTMTVMVSIAET